MSSFKYYSKKIRTILFDTSFRKLKNAFSNYILNDWSTRSYSQEGEDLILKRFFDDQRTGFYVDVGAHHPKRFSNTYMFYQKGWKGINIDALPKSMKRFDRVRPRDINIEQPISEKKQSLTYYAFNEPALNGCSKELSEERAKLDRYYIKFTQTLETERLDNLLDKYLPKDQQIDFLSIDVEGFDFSVLKSLNLQKYRPDVILIEILEDNLSKIKNNDIYKYLIDHNYLIYSKAVNTVIFMCKEYSKIKKI